MTYTICSIPKNPLSLDIDRKNDYEILAVDEVITNLLHTCVKLIIVSHI